MITALNTPRERKDFHEKLKADLARPSSKTWAGIKKLQAERAVEARTSLIVETVKALERHEELTKLMREGGKPIDEATVEEAFRLRSRFEGLRNFGRTAFGPTRAEVHIDTALTNLMATFGQGALIGDAVLPAVPVTKRTGKIFKRRLQDVQRGDEYTLRAPDAEAGEIEWGMGTQVSYETQDYKAKKTLPDYIAQDADAPINVDEITASDVVAVLGIGREIRTQALLQTAGNFASANQIAAPTTKWDASTSNNEHWDDIQAMHHAISDNAGEPGTDIIMTKKVAMALISKDHFRESTIYVDGALPLFLLGKIAEYCMVERAHIAFGRKTTSNPGQATQTQADIWNDSVVMLHQGPASTHFMGFAIRPTTTALAMASYRHPIEDRESNVIWGKEVCDEVVVNNLMGAINTDVLTA